MVLTVVAKDLFLKQIVGSKTDLLCWMGPVRGTHSSSCGTEVKTEVKTASCQTPHYNTRPQLSL